LVLLLIIIVALIGGVIGGVFGFVFPICSITDLGRWLSALTMPINVISLVLLYYDRRVRNEHDAKALAEPGALGEARCMAGVFISYRRGLAGMGWTPARPAEGFPHSRTFYDIATIQRTSSRHRRSASSWPCSRSSAALAERPDRRR
jgi:hypothetical protein